MLLFLVLQVSAESGGGGPADLGPVSVPQTGAATTGQLPSQQAFNTRGNGTISIITSYLFILAEHPTTPTPSDICAFG